MAPENDHPLKSEKWLASYEDLNEFEEHYSNNKETWDKAFKWLKKADLRDIPTGKCEIDGDRVFALVSEYRPKDINDTRFEAHKEYIDIQYVIKGIETIGVASLSKGIAITAFDVEKDVGFFEIPEIECKYYKAEPGQYFIFFPGDAHRPGIKAEESEGVKKVVVKVRV
jgi:biofilm protein TabA